MAAFDRKLVKREETTATGRWNEKGSPGLFSPVYYIIILPYGLSICPSNVPSDTPRPNFSLPQCVPV